MDTVINDIKPIYVVVSTDCQSEEPEKWKPVINTQTFCKEIAENSAFDFSTRGIQGDFYAAAEYSVSGVNIVGEIHAGMNEW